MKEETIKVKVKRYDPDSNQREHFVSYEVPYQEGMSVLNVLNYIYENIDSSLSFYYSCRIGKCLGCYVTLNGKTRLACTTKATQDMTIEPRKKLKVLKDLVVDQ